MTDTKAPTSEPAKGSQEKPAAPERPKPAPAQPHMVNDHDEDEINKGKTRLNE